MRKKCKEGGMERGKKEEYHPVKHFTVKSSSDLSTQFSFCLFSHNWNVVHVCTEPQGDRKHILAGVDRLHNGRGKIQSGDNSNRTKRKTAPLMCVFATLCSWMNVCMLLHEAADCCISEISRLSDVTGHRLVTCSNLPTTVSPSQDVPTLCTL